MSANISPRVQKEIIGFIGKNIGKHRQYIGKIKNTKILKNTKKEKNHSIFEKIGKYRDKIGKYHEKIGKNRQKKSGKYRGDILPIYRDVADISAIFVTLVYIINISQIRSFRFSFVKGAHPHPRNTTME